MKQWMVIVGIAVFVTGCAQQASETSSLTPSDMMTVVPLDQETPTSTATAPADLGPVNVSHTSAEGDASSFMQRLSSTIGTSEEIQIALKNAGYYTGTIDGNIGPKSRQAIESFQAANHLTVDGNVGPKTWAKLAPYTGASAGAAGFSSTQP